MEGLHLFLDNFADWASFVRIWPLLWQGLQLTVLLSIVTLPIAGRPGATRASATGSRASPTATLAAARGARKRGVPTAASASITSSAPARRPPYAVRFGVIAPKWEINGFH